MFRNLRLLSRAGLAVMALGLTGAGIGLAPASAQDACLDNRQIQDAVASGQIASLDRVLADAGIDGDHSVLSVQVCDEGGRLAYVIGVLSAAGEARTLVLDAQ